MATDVRSATCSLQFGQSGKQDEYESAHRRTGIDVPLNHREAGAGGAETRGKVDRGSGAPGEPGERVDDQDGLAPTGDGDRVLEPRPVVRPSAGQILSWCSATTV
jgi:hypothetical protein